MSNVSSRPPEGGDGCTDAPDKGTAAAWYASVKRWRVLPLHHMTPAGRCSCGNPDGTADHDYRQGGKHPIHKAWQQKATTNLDTIAGWYRSRPHANIGLATGRESGFFVLDVDPDNGGDEALLKLEAEHGDLPLTWCVETGSGGNHYYFNYPDFDVTNATKALRALGIHGIDIRGDGGQVVAPPSVSGKGPYISTKLEMVDAPQWLLDILRPKPRQQAAPRDFTIPTGALDTYTEKALRDECDQIIGAPDGDQNNTINIAAFNIGQLVGAGALTESEARQALLAAARAGNHPEGRAAATIESGLRAGMSDPRSPWPPVGAERIQVSTASVKRGVLRDESDVQAHFAEPPDPLGGAEMPQPPEMDPDAMLPPVLARAARAVEEHLQVPVEAPALMGISVLSTASLGRFLIRDTASGWTQPPIVRTLTLLRSGERKSDTVRLMGRPIKTAERQRWMAHQEALSRAGKDRETLELELDDVKAQLKRDGAKFAKDPAAKKALLSEMDALKARLAELPDPDANPPQLTISDSTPEALVQALHDNSECIGMLLAEDTLFAQIAGLYTGTPNLGIYLSSYDEEEYIVNRVGRGVRILWNPALAIGMLVQPHVVESAANIPGARSSGLLGRWLFAAPKSRMGERTIESPPLDSAVMGDWDAAVSRLLAMRVRPDDVPVLVLGEEARRELNAFRAWIEPLQLEVVGRFAHMTDWTGKIAGTAMRIAGLYHLAGGYGISEPVSLQTMRWAIALARWACTHAEYVHRVWRQANDVPGVEWILKWLRLRARGSDTFTRRELMRSGVARQDWYSPQALDEALAELHRARWIASVSDTDAAGRQKSTGKFIVHPALREGPRHA